MKSRIVIIICGPNKCGKSTLAKHIIDNLPNKKFEVIKCSQPVIDEKGNHAFEEYMSILDTIEANPDKNYILDRFHFGSYVYGPIYRGVPDFDLNAFVRIEERIIKLDYLFIVAIAKTSFIKEKFISEKEEFAKVELIRKEIELFEKICKMSRLNINYHRIPTKDLTKDNKILNIISLYE